MLKYFKIKTLYNSDFHKTCDKKNNKSKSRTQTKQIEQRKNSFRSHLTELAKYNFNIQLSLPFGFNSCETHFNGQSYWQATEFIIKTWSMRTIGVPGAQKWRRANEVVGFWQASSSIDRPMCRSSLALRRAPEMETSLLTRRRAVKSISACLVFGVKVTILNLCTLTTP